MIVCNFLFDPKKSISILRFFYSFFFFFFSFLKFLLELVHCNSKGYSTFTKMFKGLRLHSGGF